MDFDRHQHDLRLQRRSNRTLGLFVGLLAASNLVALVTIASIAGSERTILVPPSIDRTFWVARDQASREYLEQMAAFLAWLYLDVSPGTIDWKRNVLLNYVAPDEHAEMRRRMDLEAARLRATNGSTSFLIQQLTPNERDQSVVVAGRLRRQVNGLDTGEPETRSFLVRFQYAGGRVHVKSFKEVSNGPSS